MAARCSAWQSARIPGRSALPTRASIRGPPESFNGSSLLDTKSCSRLHGSLLHGGRLRDRSGCRLRLTENMRIVRNGESMRNGVRRCLILEPHDLPGNVFIAVDHEFDDAHDAILSIVFYLIRRRLKMITACTNSMNACKVATIATARTMKLSNGIIRPPCRALAECGPLRRHASLLSRLPSSPRRPAA